MKLQTDVRMYVRFFNASGMQLSLLVPEPTDPESSVGSSTGAAEIYADSLSARRPIPPPILIMVREII